MPRPVRLVFGVHCHQPVGNLGEVFHRALEMAYEPFLATLARHPSIRAVLHYSGCLYEWLEENAPGHLDRIAALVSRGQVEILSGGFYEPILSLLPHTDRIGQIRMQSRYIKERFGAEPKGMWLAERIWEPTLPRTLREAGIEYTLLDDYHFLGSMDGDPVGRSYVTEDLGEAVRLFPISEALRYLIPFREPQETIAWMRALADATPADGEDPVAVIVDDGEKFGLWPNTHEWVHGSDADNGWLERFFVALEENADWLRTSTFEEAATLPAGGPVYLPPASYFEMGEWSLSVGRGREYAKAVTRSKDRGGWEGERPFLRGGFFRNYLAKYPESFLSLRRAQALSSAMDQSATDQAAAVDGRPTPARRELWRATCNCGYWHGIFGGLYLPFIRRAIGEHLCRAARLFAGDVDLPRAAFVESGLAGPPNVEVVTRAFAALIEPNRGGAIRALDLRARDFPLGQTLTRRVEIYHDAVLAETNDDGAEPDTDMGHASIHDTMIAPTAEMRALVISDDRVRASAVDRFLAVGTRVSDLQAGRVHEQGDFFDGSYAATLLKDGVTLNRRGKVAGREVSIRKIIRAGRHAERLELRYRIKSTDANHALDGLFAVEFNLALIEGMGSIRVEQAGAKAGWTTSLSMASETGPATRVIVDERLTGFSIVFDLSPAAAVWHYPVRTVSRSEKGYEAIYQGAALLFVWGESGAVPAEAGITLSAT